MGSTWAGMVQGSQCGLVDKPDDMDNLVDVALHTTAKRPKMAAQEQPKFNEFIEN